MWSICRRRVAVGERARRADGDLGVRELREEAVLLQDLLPRPAPGAVELGDDAGAILALDLVDAVLERVQRVADAVAVDAGGLDGLDDLVRGQRQEEVGRGGGAHGGES